MIIYLEEQILPISVTYKKLEKTNLFSKIFKLQNKRLKEITRKPIYEDEKNSIGKMQKYFRLLMSISDAKFTFYPLTREEVPKAERKFREINGASTNKILHIFFDIDSTLTPKGIST